jgi:hypothetical protein
MWLAFGKASTHAPVKQTGQRDLFECTELSIVHAIALSAMTGLYPGGVRPDVWLIPRKNRHNNGALECNWQISSRGFQRLAARTNHQVRGMIVHANDTFEYEAAEPSILHRPSLDTVGDWNSIRCAYVVVDPPSGKRVFAVLRKDQIEKRRKKAQTDRIWSEWPEEMTIKTVLAYAGAREMWPTNRSARFAIEADAIGHMPARRVGAIGPTQGEMFGAAPTQAPTSRLEPGDLAPKDGKLSNAVSSANPAATPMPFDEMQQYESELRAKGLLDTAVEALGVPAEWMIGDRTQLNSILRKDES